MITRKDILEKLRAFSEELLKTDIADIDGETRFEDLGLDSLDMTEMSLMIEEWLPISMVNRLPRTFGEAVEMICISMKKQGIPC